MFEFMNITRALADENRIRILMSLHGRELCVCRIIEMLGLSPSTVSAHLSVLKNARLVTGRKEGRWMYYRLENGSERPVVAEAIDWVVRSVGEDPVIRDDRRALEEDADGAPAARCG